MSSRWLIFALACPGILAVSGCRSGGVNPLDVGSAAAFRYTVNDCDPTRSARSAPTVAPEVSVSGTTLRFQHTLSTYCNARSDSCLTLTQTIHDGVIEIREVYDGHAVRCTCTFPISGTIVDLSPGTYHIRFLFVLIVDGKHLETTSLYETDLTIQEEERFR